MTADPQRKRDLAAIHTGKAALALDDATYRDLLEKLTGHRSAAELDSNQRRDVIEHFRTLGFRRAAPSPSRRSASCADAHAGRATGPSLSRSGRGAKRMEPQHYKAMEIWRALYLLGAVDDGSNRALDAFCARTAKVDALRWAVPAQANKVIEALKAIAARHGYAVPDAKDVEKIDGWRRHAKREPGGYALAAHVRLIEALWTKLIVAGVMQTGAHARLDSWLMGRGYGVAAPWYLSLDQARDAAERLGLWLRRAREARGGIE